MKFLLFGGPFLVCLFGVSCSGVWSPKQKQDVVPVAVLPATLKEGF